MAKGSQLAQLKSALVNAGFTGNKQQGKKRKRPGATIEKDKEKKAAKLDEIHRRLNPFDAKVTKLKHDVGGRKLKGVSGKPAQSKQAGIEQRKKTLLKEFEERGRSGGIVDRRFGENDPTMSMEERMLERFTRERQRASKGAVFNLEDEEELTHYGQSLSKLDDFDDVGLGLDHDEEEVSGQIGREQVQKAHFGGFDDDKSDEDEGPARKKSKAEVMAEVIAKSKEHKLRRQMEKEHEENVRHELDEDFESIRDLLFAPGPSTSKPVLPPGGRPEVAARPEDLLVAESQDQDYDQRVRELAFDKRSKPTDRTKTDEELALEEKEALENAERQRRKRMLGLEESDSEEEGKSRGKRKRGGDDLEDDFGDEVTERAGLGSGLREGQENTSEGEEGEDEESEGDEDDESEEGRSGSEEDGDDVSDDWEGEEGEREELVQTTKRSKGKARASSVDEELPYTFPCPSSHEEFLEIVEGIDDKDIPTVVHRIRALHHPSLGPDNKFKLQTFTTILIDHALYVASPPSPRYSTLSSLLPHLISLIEAYPTKAAEHFVEKLSLMHKNLKRGLSKGATDPGAKTWPGSAELCLFRIIGSVWSSSDLNHAVVSPARILMGAYLGLCRVRSLSDVASGLFLCTLFYQFESLSKRFVPEAMNFLVNTVLHLSPTSYKDVASLPGSFPSPDFRSDSCRPLLLNPRKQDKVVLQKASLPSLLSLEKPTEQAKADLLGLALHLIGLFADMYKGLDGFIELYDPILEVLQHIDDAALFSDYQVRLKTLCNTLQRLLKFSRQARTPLRLQAHKPIPIATYIPKFETTTSSYLRRQDPDHERNEAAKLRNQYKQERKGAIRELRKDAKFLAGVQQQMQREKDRAYNDRMKRVFGAIEGERAEEKAMQREKAKLKKRAGRK